MVTIVIVARNSLAVSEEAGNAHYYELKIPLYDAVYFSEF